jgi:enoyl-CoA hydratase
VFDAIESLPIPVIAAVNGFALGGGCELSLACDLVLAAPNAVFGQPEVKLGVIPGFGGTQRLVRRVGSMRARELVYTGRNVKAEEAVAIGLALRVVTEGSVKDAALAMAEQIAAMGPVAVRLAKRAILDGDGADLRVGLAGERTLFALCFATTDQKEGMAAFLEKRPPAFRGE